MAYLENINSPVDLKKLTLPQLEVLANEIREFLIKSVAETGGHLSSNLGVCELTIALHYCYNTPVDKIIWDVGHQSYIHKILTGRRDKFGTLRKFKGLSGFPKTLESEYDAFDTGHSSTSVSVACGFAAARDLKGESHNVIAVIGDGSMTGGLAYEALNNAGRSNADMTVILNDNQMSISENVGGMSRYLNSIRTAPTYIAAKKDIKTILNYVPFVGRGVGHFIEKLKDSIKFFLLHGTLFDELGFKYFGPIDGNNLSEVINALNKIKKISGPVLLHVYTKKGKGYDIAENQPMKFHGIDSFDIETGSLVKEKTNNTYTDIFSKKIVQMGQTHENITAITASMCSGTGLTAFQKEFPKRTFDVGIAEAHGAAFAAGLAKSGIVPVFAVYSTFLQRAYDQLLHDVCLQKLPVILAVDRAGIVGSDGETHQGAFDLSFLSHIPNMSVMAPKNGRELEEMLEFAYTLGAPCAIRYPRGEASRLYSEKSQEIALGKSEVLEDGQEIAVIAIGSSVLEASCAVKMLQKSSYSPKFINARFAKPVDREMLLSLLGFKYIFTVEDNVLSGGFGAECSRVLIEAGFNRTFRSFGIPDEFIEHGSREELLRMLNLDSEGIYRRIIKIVKNKNN